MSVSIFQMLGEQLRRARLRRQLTQPALAGRLGRDRARISELERDLASNRMGRDRLTLVAEICDALDLVPILVPRGKVDAVRGILDEQSASRGSGGLGGAAFDDVFVDLSDDEAGR